MSATPWIVHKFGGSSLANARCFHQVSEILEAGLHTRQAVVVSAVSDVTDALLGLSAIQLPQTFPTSSQASVARCRAI